MTTQKYANDLRNVIDFNRYIKLIASMDKQLNGRKDRFDRSDIIEQSIEIYSNGRLKWVDDIGRDHTDTVLNVDDEFKYITDGLYTKAKKTKATVKVKIKNSLGANKGTTIDDPADYYIIAQQDAMAIISYEEIKPYLVSVPDGIEAHIPFNKLSMIFTPSDVKEIKTVAFD